MTTPDRTASAPLGTEAAPTTENVPDICRTCQLRVEPCGYYPEECEIAEERAAARRHKDEVDAMAWALDRVFDYPKREEAAHGHR